MESHQYFLKWDFPPSSSFKVGSSFFVFFVWNNIFPEGGAEPFYSSPETTFGGELLLVVNFWLNVVKTAERPERSVGVVQRGKGARWGRYVQVDPPLNRCPSHLSLRHRNYYYNPCTHCWSANLIFFYYSVLLSIIEEPLWVSEAFFTDTFPVTLY